VNNLLVSKIILSEIDLDALHKIARGKSYKQVALDEGLTEATIRNRMSAVIRTFGATSITNLVAILIASDVLRLHDLYQDIDVHVREYKRTAVRYGRGATYRLYAVRA
jgi:DNA-binding CsgD family transcriptional regulator